MDTPSRDPNGDRRRVDELDARLQAARQQQPVKRPDSGNRAANREANVAYRVMVDMIAGLLLGGFFGYWLDRWTGWAPYSMIVMILLGFAAGANNAWRTIRTLSERAAKGDDDGDRHAS